MRIELKGLFLICLVVLHPNINMVSAEEYEFQAEVGRLMDILINSLYTEKEIFLRELISNASDALDKIRFLSVSNPQLLGDNKDLQITIESDSTAKTLTITDTGVGMTKNDLIQNLGTIAKSGTTHFMEAIKSGNINIIGQFGVGFYSTFLVSQRVTVTSKHADDEQYIWESSAANSFTIERDPAGNTLGRGTKIVIHLKEDSGEYADEKTLETLIKKYSEFINFPIKLQIWKQVSKEVEVEEEEAAPAEKTEGEEAEKKDDDIDVEDVDENAPKEPVKKTKTVKEKVPEWKVVNDNKAIWLRPKDEIEDEEYKKFYKSLTKDYDDPLSWMHFKTEGEVEFTSVLYIPKKAPHDLFENYYGKSAALKLYVRRVLINEEFEELMPRYLNFIKGVVDSDELPINVARDSIQQVKMLKVMSRKLVRKALEMIKKLSEDEEEDTDDEEEDDDKNDEDK